MKTHLLSFSILALGTAVGILSFAAKPVQTFGTALPSEQPYDETFEEFAVGDTGATVYDAGLFWFGDTVNASIADHESSKALKYAFSAVGNDGYTKLGGIGIGVKNNLVNLVVGARYTLSLKVDVSAATAGSLLYIEYQNTTINWTGVTVAPGMVVANLNASTTTQVAYANNVLSFSFIAGKYNDLNSYITLTGKGLSVSDVIYLDDFSLTRDIYAWNEDFQSYAVDTEAPANNASNISYVYSGGSVLMDSVKIAADVGGNKFLEAKRASQTSNSWPTFYFNRLPLTSGHNYRLSFDFISHNFGEFYIDYNDNNVTVATYSPTAFVSKSDSPYVLGGSFDGTHLTYDFAPNTSISANWWNQMLLVFYQPTGVALDCQIDNVKILDLSAKAASLSLDTSATTLDYDINGTLDFSKLAVKLVRENGETRTLKSGEYTIDSSAVDLTQVGTYTVSVSAFDELNNQVSATFQVGVSNFAGDATAWATSFLSATNVCDATGATNNITTEIWNNQKTAFTALSTGAKSILSASDGTGTSDVDKAIARYTFIVRKYSLEDFMDRHVLGSILPKQSVLDDQTTILSAIGFVTLSVLVVFSMIALKKKRA